MTDNEKAPVGEPVEDGIGMRCFGRGGDVRVLKCGAEGGGVGEGVVVGFAPAADQASRFSRPGATSQELAERCRTGRSPQSPAVPVVMA
ncbi:hypothetical protein ACFTY7_31300 [Streptomyces sp. NPDC057062]|uniref:hypothetical protein n=1 Tax=unclassified Streptomyces TaxID=2593676 RepID=UPI001C6E2F5B|nr:hypothetical protein [Streptomyces sp. MBT84]